MTNSIDPAPLNGVLSMRGVVADGIYRAAIGRIVLVNGTPIGREMRTSTSIVIFGSNDRAFAQAEMIVSPDEPHALRRGGRCESRVEQREGTSCA